MNQKRHYELIVFISFFLFLFSCSDEKYNENIKQKPDTTIVKVDIPLGENHYDSTFYKRKSKYFITIGTDTSDLVTQVRENKSGTLSIYISNKDGWG